MTPEVVIELRRRVAAGALIKDAAAALGVGYYSARSAVRGLSHRSVGGPVTPPSRTEHGMGRAPEYTVWCSMVKRCTKKTERDYPLYGGRGIRVCDRWRSDFLAFLADMGPRPSPTHSIDRIDNDGNYEPGNCRWATDAEQRRNKRTTRMVEFRGERMCVADMARKYSLTPFVVYGRLNNGWPVERALTEPVRR